MSGFYWLVTRNFVVMMRRDGSTYFHLIGFGISHQFLAQILERGKAPSGGHVAFDPGKPQLEVVEPGRIDRSEVELDVKMFFEKALPLSRFVNGDIVQDDVDFSVAGLPQEKLFEKGDEISGWYGGTLSFPGPCRFGYQRRQTATESHDDNRESPLFQPVQETSAAGSPCSPRPGWRSFHPHKTQPRTEEV